MGFCSINRHLVALKLFAGGLIIGKERLYPERKVPDVD